MGIYPRSSSVTINKGKLDPTRPFNNNQYSGEGEIEPSRILGKEMIKSLTEIK